MADTGIKVDIDGEAINKAVAAAIIDSALGTEIAKAVDDALKAGRHGQGSLVQGAVSAALHEQVRLFCREVVREPETAAKIRAAIREGLSEERLGEITDAFVAQLGLITTADMGL